MPGAPGKTFKSLIACAAFLTIVIDAGAAHELSGLNAAQTDFVESCEANFDSGRQDPSVAGVCIIRLKEPELFDKLQRTDRPRLEMILSKASALSDLAALVYNPEYSQRAFSNYVADRITNSSMLTMLELGPQPEKIIAWTEKYLPGREEFVKKGIRQWETLCEARKAYLTKGGLNETKWNNVTMASRQDVLSEWAENRAKNVLGDTDSTLTASAQFENALSESNLLWDDLSDKTRTALNDRMGELEAAAKNDEKIANSNIFSRAFGGDERGDNKNNSSSVSSEASVGLSKDEVSAIVRVLAELLIKELEDTQTGQRVISFYKAKAARLRLSSAAAAISLRGADIDKLAQYGADNDNIEFSVRMIQRWLTSKGFTLQELESDGEKLAELAGLLRRLLCMKRHMNSSSFGSKA